MLLENNFKNQDSIRRKAYHADNPIGLRVAKGPTCSPGCTKSTLGCFLHLCFGMFA